ncbi:MAG: transcription-repair coupling factor [Acidobacteriota bacterium]
MAEGALKALFEILDELPCPESGAVAVPEGARSLLLARLSRRTPLLVVGTRQTATPERRREIEYFTEGAGVVYLPPLFEAPVLQIPPHPEAELERVKGLMRCLDGTARVALMDWKSFITPVEDALGLIDRIKRIKVGDEISRDDLQETLVRNGYRREDLTTGPGEYSFRGAVVDVFSPYHEMPVRIEFELDRVVSLRTFDGFTQLSRETIPEVSLIPLHEQRRAMGHNVTDYLEGFRIVIEEPAQIAQELEQWKAGLHRQAELTVDLGTGDDAAALLLPMLLAGIERLDATLKEAPLTLQEFSTDALGTGLLPQRSFQGLIEEWVKDVQAKIDQGRRILVVLQSRGLVERVRELLNDRNVRAEFAGDRLHAGRLSLATGFLQKGFEWPSGYLDLYSETDVFGPLPEAPARPRRKSAAAFQADLRDLRPGDYVTHVECGIGLFKGLTKMEIEGQEREFMHLEYDGGDKLYVPMDRMELVEKYRAPGGAAPSVDKLGGTGWEKTKKRVKKAVEEMAVELLNLYAERRLVSGHAYGPDTTWQREFEEMFEYEPTEDQQHAIVDTKADLEREQPMDRLICGDVGYGKTEVAMRGAMKVVQEGKQVAVLAPTTVLAYQHWRTFRRRFEAFPIRTELLSRFRTKAEQAKVVTDLAAGTVDIVIGTHRLLSKDVSFRDLGLLVVDEEQRFGVAHKERVKQMKKNVDVMALSATPIPRTLQMSLAGIRDMSVIETPPRDRLAIHTQVLVFKPDVIQAAIRFELGRGGQVFFVHNRIESLPSLANFLMRLCPEARISIAHGQMAEKDLEARMQEFVDGRTDVLLSTSIIENGLDIPRVNTLIVNRADKFGLAQLYQLRGRVGRSSRRAYAYLLVPEQNVLSAVARKRLAALKEFTDLGAGFRIAAMDLELRGAGSLLGHRQHGHMEAVGYDMYCRLLERTVEEFRSGRPVEEPAPVTINLGWDIRIDESYIPDTNQRLQMYKRVSSASCEEDLAAIRAEMQDRYGKMPEGADRLFAYGRIKAEAKRAGVRSIDLRGRDIVFRFPETPSVSPDRILDVARVQGGRLQPGGQVSLVLRGSEEVAARILEFLEALSAA